MQLARLLLPAVVAALAPTAGGQEEVSRLAFGSCFKTDGSPGVWNAIGEWDPELLMLIGDNVYADTEDIVLMRERYRALAEIPEFAGLRAGRRFLATWDDHDYGANDAGSDYPMRAESQRVFLDFCGEPADSPRRATPGVYAARIFGPPGTRLQVILLDTRYFRSRLERRTSDEEAALGHAGPYRPSLDRARTMLGPTQWAWLEERLREPAEVRVVASSIQVVAEDHGYETWANLPLERKRLFQLIRDTGAEGVIFVSGDRHKAELSILDPARAASESAVDVGYPIHDVTSSSLNSGSSWWNEVNRHRRGSQYFGANFGTIEIAWALPDPRITLRIHADDGKTLLRHDLKASELRR